MKQHLFSFRLITEEVLPVPVQHWDQGAADPAGIKHPAGIQQHCMNILALEPQNSSDDSIVRASGVTPITRQRGRQRGRQGDTAARHLIRHRALAPRQ